MILVIFAIKVKHHISKLQKKLLYGVLITITVNH